MVIGGWSLDVRAMRKAKYYRKFEVGGYIYSAVQL